MAHSSTSKAPPIGWRCLLTDQWWDRKLEWTKETDIGSLLEGYFSSMNCFWFGIPVSILKGDGITFPINDYTTLDYSRLYTHMVRDIGVQRKEVTKESLVQFYQNNEPDMVASVTDTSVARINKDISLFLNFCRDVYKAQPVTTTVTGPTCDMLYIAAKFDGHTTHDSIKNKLIWCNKQLNEINESKKVDFGFRLKLICKPPTNIRDYTDEATFLYDKYLYVFLDPRNNYKLYSVEILPSGKMVYCPKHTELFDKYIASDNSL